MRGIKIDPGNRTIEEIKLEKNPNETFEELYGIIGCSLVQPVQLDRGICLLCDEEGKCKEIKGGFTFFGSEDLVIAGVAVVVGGDVNRFKSLRENVENFRKIVKWVDPADVPPAKFEFFPLN